jgi:DNA-binding MarR family transcriptional regulator
VTKSDTLSPAEWEIWHAWTEAQRVFAREVERLLQRDFGISKAEFSVLVSLHRAAETEVRVSELASALEWDKSRVAHLLTRMESRGLTERTETGAKGRRTGIRLTANGRDLADSAVQAHAGTIRRLFLDPLTMEQTTAIRQWSDQMIARG